MAGSALKRLMAEYKHYGDSVWYPTLKKDKRAVENVQRRVTRCLPALSHLSYEERLAALNLPTQEYRRCRMDMIQLTLNPPEGIIAGPMNEENFFEWEALIMGPEGTCFEGGVFPAQLTFPADYPLSPPKMKFTCDLFHPNIYPDGRVCISILHAPGDDPMGYETSAERWSPVQSVEKILLSVVSMLSEPNDESAANVDAAKTWREDRQRFDEIADRTVRKSLGLEQKYDNSGKPTIQIAGL